VPIVDPGASNELDNFLGASIPEFLHSLSGGVFFVRVGDEELMRRMRSFPQSVGSTTHGRFEQEVYSAHNPDLRIALFGAAHSGWVQWRRLCRTN
jgi:hypothetical protein